MPRPFSGQILRRSLFISSPQCCDHLFLSYEDKLGSNCLELRARSQPEQGCFTCRIWSRFRQFTYLTKPNFDFSARLSERSSPRGYCFPVHQLLTGLPCSRGKEEDETGLGNPEEASNFRAPPIPFQTFSLQRSFLRASPKNLWN